MRTLIALLRSAKNAKPDGGYKHLAPSGAKKIVAARCTSK
jgi:hypothetical protein